VPEIADFGGPCPLHLRFHADTSRGGRQIQEIPEIGRDRTGIETFQVCSISSGAAPLPDRSSGMVPPRRVSRRRLDCRFEVHHERPVWCVLLQEQTQFLEGEIDRAGSAVASS